MTVNKREQEKLRKRLEERRAEIESDVSYMAAEMRYLGVDQDDENGSLGNHIGDDGSYVTEAERIVTVSEDLQQILNQVTAALVRWNNGNYGACQRCGNPLGGERLAAFPDVASCLEWQ
ncbi:MAG: hypothetical protein KY456_09605, partial [Chloroflexi bacterium]|nr:hypothetical protein [Chloroflexota bacterium]